MISLILNSACELNFDGTPSTKKVQITIASELQSEYNKFSAYFTFGKGNTVHIPLVLTSNVSQEMDLEKIGSKLMQKVTIFVYCEDDTMSDGDGYEGKYSTSVVLEFDDKTLADYGITDAYTKTDVNNLLANKADKSELPTKVSDLENDAGYLTQHQDISGKADKATSLAGYGIEDAYTKTEINATIGNVETLLSEV